MENGKVIIGILGGVCSGKSTVAREFGRLGCAVIDADRIASEVLERPDVQGRLKKAFGNEICCKEGLIERGKLADIVFDNSENVRQINEIIHPAVLAEIREQIRFFGGQEGLKGIVLDVPLLLEAGGAGLCDATVFVDCPEEIRAMRAEKKGFLWEKQLKKREKFQISLDKKAKIADYMVHNNSDLSALTDQVTHILSTLIQ